MSVDKLTSSGCLPFTNKYYVNLIFQLPGCDKKRRQVVGCVIPDPPNIGV